MFNDDLFGKRCECQRKPDIDEICRDNLDEFTKEEIYAYYSQYLSTRYTMESEKSRMWQKKATEFETAYNEACSHLKRLERILIKLDVKTAVEAKDKEE